MSSGTLEPRKNFKAIIHAMALLPKGLKDQIQFVIVGSGEELYTNEMRELAQKLDITSSLILAGHVTDDELILLYNQSELFVFASLHEGFGLPPLEAMSCGIPAIASNTTSLPEVINNPEALIDPMDPQNIADKIMQVLMDQVFRQNLVAHSLKQSKNFSWDITAQKALSAIEPLIKKVDFTKLQHKNKPVLAYVSPLPPEHTGIADYSAELLPELAEYYKIIVIVDQSEVSDDWILTHCSVHTPDWLRLHRDEVDRVIYHFGNSYFHSFMYSLLEDIPGIVVLHDFFVSNLFISLEDIFWVKNAWRKELYAVHGYQALADSFQNYADAKMNYPVSKKILENATSVIVHSEHSKKLANKWYGNGFSDNWKVIPLLRKSASNGNKAQAKELLGFAHNDFIVGSFGILDQSKLNHVTLSAWIKSALSTQKNSKLVFIGQGFEGDYFNNMVEMAKKTSFPDRIYFSGRCEMDVYRLYLEAVDVAVQLRTSSRGETSAAVLDCMNYSIPTIVNANGSMAELNQEAVEMLPDVFDEKMLSQLLEQLYNDSTLREHLSQRAKEVINTVNDPATCAKLYFDAIESAHIEKHQPQKRILLDVTATAQNGLRTGIERVARAIVSEMIKIDSKNYRVEPVYLTCDGGLWHYKYARQFTLGLLNCPVDVLADEIVVLTSEDLILGLDISHRIIDADEAGFYTDAQKIVTKIYHMLHDLLPISMPHVFPSWAEDSHQKWLKVIAKFDGVIGVSKTVADEFEQWLSNSNIQSNKNIEILWNHHGADIDASTPSVGLPDNSDMVLRSIKRTQTFLMVGTIEPRKGYLQIVNAFSELWNDGFDINLVIVGGEGWKSLLDEDRRTIPETIKTIEKHPELNKKLFWLEGVSDEYLEKVYETSTCLIAASEGEGFGLPLIEAAQHKKPIIARDIPVFKEVAGEFAYYFDNSNDSVVLEKAIKEWLEMYRNNEHPKSDNMPWLTWKESVNSLIKKIFGASLT
jgi:glycosyltransferase involved in cell wall biosynthesis